MQRMHVIDTQDCTFGWPLNIFSICASTSAGEAAGSMVDSSTIASGYQLLFERCVYQSDYVHWPQRRG